MSTYTVGLTHRADKQFSKLESKIKVRINEAIDALKENPAPVNSFDVTKLTGSQLFPIGQRLIRGSLHRIALGPST